MNVLILLVLLHLKLVALKNQDSSPLEEYLNDAESVMRKLGQREIWNNLLTLILEPYKPSTNTKGDFINLCNEILDTLQQHISLWNEQLTNIYKKIVRPKQAAYRELIYERLSVNTFEEIVKRLKNLENKISKHFREREKSYHTLTTEYVLRGVMAALKTIEHKIDKIYVVTGKLFLKSIPKSPQLNLERTTSPLLEVAVKELSFKVDVILDKVSNLNEDIDQGYNTEDYPEIQELTKQNVFPEIDILKKILKRINQPCIKNNQLMEDVLNIASRIENTSRIILDAQMTNLEKFREEQSAVIDQCSKNFRLTQNLQLTYQNVEQMLLENNAYIKNVLQDYFRDQTTHFESALNKTYPCLSIK